MSDDHGSDNRHGWDASYLSRGGGLPPWYELDCKDLGEFLGSSRVDLSRAHRIIDMGAGIGFRTMLAVAMNAAMNRPEVRVSCVEFSATAVGRGRELWDAVRTGAASLRAGAGGVAQPRCELTFHLASVCDLPGELVRSEPDVVIDWMMLHGLPRSLWERYSQSLLALNPRWILLKCFTSKHGTITRLTRSVNGVQKHQLSDADVLAFLGSRYRVVGLTRDWPEVASPQGHSEPEIAAKRAYCLERI
jgi:hypothetical protein